MFARDGVERAAVPHSILRVLDETIEIDGEPAGYSDHAGLLAEIDFERAPTFRPPPDGDAVARAADYLREGRGKAEQRRRDHLGIAAGGGAVALAAVGSASFAPISRRRLLRASLLGLPVLALGASTGIGVLAKRSVDAELAGYDKVEGLLAEIARSANSGARDAGAAAASSQEGAA